MRTHVCCRRSPQWPRREKRENCYGRKRGGYVMEGRIGRRGDFEEGLLLKWKEDCTGAGHWTTSLTVLLWTRDCQRRRGHFNLIDWPIMAGVSKRFGLFPILIPFCFQEIGNEIHVWEIKTLWWFEWRMMGSGWKGPIRLHLLRRSWEKG